MKRIVEPLRSANQEFFLQRNNPTIEDCQLSKTIKSKIEIKQKVIPLLKGLSHLEVSEIKIFNSNRKKKLSQDREGCRTSSFCKIWKNYYKQKLIAL